MNNISIETIKLLTKRDELVYRKIDDPTQIILNPRDPKDKISIYNLSGKRFVYFDYDEDDDDIY